MDAHSREMNKLNNGYSELGVIFKPSANRQLWFFLGALLPMLTAMVALKTYDADAIRASLSVVDPVPAEAFPFGEIQNADSVVTQTAQVKPAWIALKISQGDTLSKMFAAHNLPLEDMTGILAALDNKEAEILGRLRPGDEIKLHRDESGRVVELIRENGYQNILKISLTQDGYRAETLPVTVETKQHYRQITINGSLYAAGQEAGLNDQMINQIAQLFAWDIDFSFDVQAGDKVSVIYQEMYRAGKKVADGDIIAAEFRSRNKRLRVVRFETPDGRFSYYTPDGQSIRKAFLRTPVDYARVSSQFSLGRLHPVLNTMRAHQGTDYAAPIGTPVRASGNARVEFSGRLGGYGNVIILEHNNSYSTRYGHLSRFAKGLKQGDWVRQGDIIGYVGKTGLATGPHLHYELRVNGVAKDPEKLIIKPAEPIHANYMKEFRKKTIDLLVRLDAEDAKHLASSATVGMSKTN